MSLRFWEAMKALEEGKKVRMVRWPSGGYIEPKTKSISKSSPVCGDYFDTGLMSSIDERWEIYEEPQEPEKLYLWIFKGSDSNWHVDNRLRSKEKYGKHIPTAQVLDGPWIEEDGKLVRVEND